MNLSSIYQSKSSSKKLLFLYSEINAGFPSPADDHTDIELDLNEHLIKHPSATFYVYARGNSMINSGIYDGDLLIVDKSLSPRLKSVIIAVIDGEFTVKRITRINKKLYLLPDNDSYEPIKITSSMKFEVWGVVTYTIHKPQ